MGADDAATPEGAPPAQEEPFVPRLARQEEPAEEAGREGRKGSIIAAKYADGEWQHSQDNPPPPKYPNNEEIAKAVQQKVAAAVEMSRKYQHVGWYSLFVAVYMVVLWLQANSYQASEVVATLKQQFLDDPTVTKMVFTSEDQVLQYIGSKILLPIWSDPLCGDGQCEYPWEYPAWGRFGCMADCGTNTNTTHLAVVVKGDFTGHPSISPRNLMVKASWNLCMNDRIRRSRGEADLCWFDDDQAFTQTQSNIVTDVKLIDGDWYIKVSGDYAGRVNGMVYNIQNSDSATGVSGSGSDQPPTIPITPSFDACVLDVPRSGINGLATRKLLTAFTSSQYMAPEEGRAALAEGVEHLKAAVAEMKAMQKHMVIPDSVKDRVRALIEKANTRAGTSAQPAAE